MPNTPIAALPAPSLSDAPNGPAQVLALATALDDKIVPRFSTTTTRDAAITAPVAGQVCWTTTPATHWYYNGSAWIVVGGSAYGRCRLRRVANQSILNAAATAISWDTEDLDSGGYITAPGTTLAIPSGLDGLYGGTVRAAGVTGTNVRNFAEFAITSSLAPADFRVTSAPAAENRLVAYYMGPLAAGDTVICNILQSSGSTQNFTAWLSLARIAPL